MATTVQIWNDTAGWLRPGQTEREISAYMHDHLDTRGITPAWDRAYCPTVIAGPDSPGFHAGVGADPTATRSMKRSLVSHSTHDSAENRWTGLSWRNSVQTRASPPPAAGSPKRVSSATCHPNARGRSAALQEGKRDG